MALKNQKNFTAKIEGVGVSDIKGRIDYTLDELNERMECVNDVLEYGDMFYQEYYDKHCKVDITCDDYLLSEGNVSQSLESMANYILAKDPEYNKTEDNYYIREQELIKKNNKEDEFNGTDESLIEGLDVGEGFQPPKNNQNFKKLKKQSIDSSDLLRTDELGSVLRDYNSFLNLISKYTKKHYDSEGNIIHMPGKKAELYVYTKHHSAVRDDMIICKDSLMRTHGYNLRYFSESTMPDYSKIDMTNKEHLLGSWVQYSDRKVKSNGLLSFTPTDDYQDDFNCIIVDVQNLVDKAELTDVESEVLELYRKGLRVFQIVEELGLTKKKVEKALDRIANKVSNLAKKN